MSDLTTFKMPVITNADISMVTGRMGLPDNAFFGEDGHDERAVVLKEMGDIDVCACPGSGKTTLLVAKLGALMANWPFPAHGICVLSHTNVARSEISDRLGTTPSGSRLLSYPHFIGTIHGFVNQFLAMPWLEANGIKVKIVDTELALKRRWNALPWKTRNALENAHLNSSILRARSVEFSVGSIKWGKGELGPTTPTHKELIAAVKKSIIDGILCYEEMFVWANDFLEKRPAFAETLRTRFPLVLIDEAQDTTAEQGAIIDRIFKAGGSNVVVQRYGDPNQAIFNHDGEEHPCSADLIFPQDAIQRALPTSHRFGQEIADLADPLGLCPYTMIGRGPTKIAGSDVGDVQNTIFLFDDQDGAKRVPKSFASLLFEIFSEDQLSAGVFKAVGQVHKRTDDNNFPKHVGHYWDLYDPMMSRMEPVPATFVEYVLAGCLSAEIIGETFPALEKIADGFLKLLDIVDFKASSTGYAPRGKHRRVLRILESVPEQLSVYRDFCHEFAVKKSFLTKSLWEDVWMGRISAVVREVTACDPQEIGPAKSFLNWSSVDIADIIREPSRFATGNTLTFSKGDSTVSIQFGSIHSVKGETHNATLVFETFKNAHNLYSIGDWLTGKNVGATKKCSSENLKRLKLHYVAMTRPSHMICLALHRPSFFAKSKDGGIEMLAALQTRGWKISIV